ncbi:MAG: PAS domain S-box protein, partial [Desulfobulbaceae bacterium]|nr:PAS domain S-box protein [Desulfobulbaceae bacterium]
MLKRSVLFPLLTLVLFSCSLQSAESAKLNTAKSFSRYNIELTENEQKWLEQNPIVKARVGANPPLHFYDGQYRGISVDYLNRIGEIVGFKVEYVHGIPWYEAIEEIKKGKKFDLLLTAKNTKERQAYMRFSDDYLLMPWVIFSRIKSDFISSIDDLNGRTVAVEKSFVMQKLLMTEYPDINLVVRKHSPEALEAVASGEADAYIGNLATSTYLINRYNLTNLKVACPALFGDHNQAFAVRYDWPEFVSILNKAIKAIPARELTELRNKWFNVKFEYGVSKTDLFKWVGIVIGTSSILLLFFVFWNQRLKKEIRERKAALQAVETSARQYHGMLQSTMDGFWIIDKDGMIVDVNNTICEMLGYTRDQLLTMSLADVEVEENDEDVRQHIKKIITTGYDRFESRHKRKDGAVLDVEISSTYIQEPNAYFCTFIRDITERKQAEVNLRESENRHRTLFESMVQGIVYQDRTGTIISANPAAENILGLTLDQMVGRTSVDPRWKTIHEDGSAFPGDTHPAMVSLKSGKPVKNVIMGISNPQNQKHTWVIVNSMPRFNTGENVPYQVYTTFEDITERKKAEADNLKLYERLKQSQKMEAIGTLAGGIAHDFNNILSAILGYTEMAREDVPPDSTVAKDLDKVLEGGNRAKDLVQQILAFSRQDEMKKIPLQPASVVKEAIKMLRPSLP